MRDYRSNGFFTRFRNTMMWALIVKSFAVYIADIYTAISLLAIGGFRAAISKACSSNEGHSGGFYISDDYSKAIFCGCILFSFLLLAYEAHKSRAIIRSRDISYAYTNVMANNYYSMRSYDHFCFFCQINNSKKKKDEFAFFIFFTFKGWKRLLVADGPRQTINALTLFNYVKCKNFSTTFGDYTNGNWTTAVLLLTMAFTVIVFAASLILLVVACAMYIPLLCYIKGNLKEYCCHKIDKRISELVLYKKRQRLVKQAAIARREAEGDFRHLKNKKGQMVGKAIPQPTLPTLDIDVLRDDGKPIVVASRRGSVESSVAQGGPGAMGYDDYNVPPQQHFDSPGFGPVAFHGSTPPASSKGHGSSAFYGSGEDAASHTHLMAYPPQPGSDYMDGMSTPNTLSPEGGPVHVRGMMNGGGGGPTLHEVMASSHGHGSAPYPPASDAGYSSSRGGHYSNGSSLAGRGAPVAGFRAPSRQAGGAGASPAMGPIEYKGGVSAAPGYPPPPQVHGAEGLHYPPPPVDLSTYMPYSEEVPATNYRPGLPASPAVDPFSDPYQAEQQHHYQQEQCQPSHQQQQDLYASDPLPIEMQHLSQAPSETASRGFKLEDPGAQQPPNLTNGGGRRVVQPKQQQQQPELRAPQSTPIVDEDGTNTYCSSPHGGGQAELDPPSYRYSQQHHPPGLTDEVNEYLGTSSGNGGLSEPAMGNPRQPSMNFEDIYASYDVDEPQHGGGTLRRPGHDSLLDAYDRPESYSHRQE